PRGARARGRRRPPRQGSGQGALPRRACLGARSRAPGRAAQGRAVMTMHGAAHDDAWIYGDLNDDRLKRSSRVVWIVAAGFLAFLVWAHLARLDEVATGSGRVVPTMREQTIQSLEGGILSRIAVAQDDIVEPGQVLAQLDPTRSTSDLEEGAARHRTTLARVARREAEVGQKPLVYPKELDDHPDLLATERRLYETRRRSLAESLELVDDSLALIRDE